MASNNSTEIELTPQAQNPSAATLADVELLPNGTATPADSNEGHSLPPTDGGKDAWLFLFACFMLEAMIWGA
jgi:hypothetical protein